ncbi:MAG: SpoIIE family protein phosphatase [Pyrinomonadaceae bacterium]|nr:SpoIIE family protein phosphatase [Pyrinomonadaceae bacterium]
MRSRKIITGFLSLLIFILLSAEAARSQSNQEFSITAENLQQGKQIELDKLKWRYHAGDDAAWAAAEFDDSSWEQVEGTKINPQSLPQSGWNGRGWFRLRFNLDEKLVNKNLALVMVQNGASEIYLDGRLLATFGEIKETGDTEYNPNRLPIPFKLDKAGEHILAVRFSSSLFADTSRGVGGWIAGGGGYPRFVIVIRDASDIVATISKYALDTSMRGGFFFIGFLCALALLHLLLYIFYRAERANLYYSIFAAAFAINMICGNYRTFGHQGTLPTLILSLIGLLMLGLTFTVLPAFLLVAFRRPIGRIFWTLTALWIVGLTLYGIFLSRYTAIRVIPNILIALSFTYCIVLLINALRKKLSGAWILFGGVLALQLGMFVLLLGQLGVLNIPQDFYFLAELLVILGVPVSVSVFLARNFARTNRDLEAQLVEVERLSEQQIEQERHAAELRAENERRARELEEARELQLSMLPAKVPQLPNLEIAAHMKPATEVGGDYYDFHVGDDGTLTVAVGDATGHGLKAGSVVTATKSLFNAFAAEPNISSILEQSNLALKKMNLRGLYMAMTMLKVKDRKLLVSVAGMPPMLIYRAATRRVEEVVIRAMPLGSVRNFHYLQHETSLSAGDTVVLMSDGFAERFNPKGEMLDYEKAKEVLAEIAGGSPQEIIDRFVEVGEEWAGSRPQDDDVTFVVLKMNSAAKSDVDK